jgi:cytochrome c biogenesis protein CcmG, thiol:disulfide interchange protein DsbE
MVMIMIMNPSKSQNVSIVNNELTSLNGARIKTTGLIKPEQNTLIVFWNADDKASLEQLKELNDSWLEGKVDRSVRIIAVCTDYSGVPGRIRPLVNGLGIEFETYIDINSEMKRAMNVPSIPFSCLYSGHGKDSYAYQGHCADLAVWISARLNEEPSDLCKGK